MIRTRSVCGIKIKSFYVIYNNSSLFNTLLLCYAISLVRVFVGEAVHVNASSRGPRFLFSFPRRWLDILFFSSFTLPAGWRTILYITGSHVINVEEEEEEKNRTDQPWSRPDKNSDKNERTRIAPAGDEKPSNLSAIEAITLLILLLCVRLSWLFDNRSKRHSRRLSCTTCVCVTRRQTGRAKHRMTQFFYSVPSFLPPFFSISLFRDDGPQSFPSITNNYLYIFTFCFLHKWIPAVYDTYQ